jgi:beta-glucosidase
MSDTRLYKSEVRVYADNYYSLNMIPISKKARNIILVTISMFIAYQSACAQAAKGYRNPQLPTEQRIQLLLESLTLEEKISMLGFRNPGIPRLGIPAYNWWNEALHGVARAGKATVYPQAIALAATFNDSLIWQVADAISTEARAKYNLASQLNRREQYMGLTFWSPNINIFRDPRWGRGQETYGEDPYLTARTGSAFIRGLQGSDVRYLKTSACAKHYAVHSGPESTRHTFNAIVDEKDLRETYLYAFRSLVDAGVESVMCGYNRVNGEPCCTSNTLLKKILKDEWKFKGHIVTDCWALEDIWKRHKVMGNATEVAAAAVNAGINMDCSNLLQDDLLNALKQNLITEASIDQALKPSLRTQFKLGFYDDPAMVPFSKLGEESIHNNRHIDLARKAAQQSMVLLKNDKNLLPFSREKYKSLMVIGPNAANADALLGNYHGVSSTMVTFVEGITEAAGSATGVQYDLGCTDSDTTHFGGIWAAGNSDAIIAVVGLSPISEGEEGDAFMAPKGGDRVDLNIPRSHLTFLKALRKTNKPTVVVVTSGSAVDISAIEPYADAIILAWYPGEQGGNALADIVFGEVSPSGKLPVTFYKSLTDLPSYDDYSMKGRTYRYFNGDVQYPFGFGLSFTSFAYRWSKEPLKAYSFKDTISIDVSVKNTGNLKGDEVAQLYIQYPDGDRMPVIELKGYQRVSIEKGMEKIVRFRLPVNDLVKWDLSKKKWSVVKGMYKISIGSDSKDIRLRKEFIVKG